jgi:hypothetical protein
VLPHQEASYVRHIALDIGGSLIKLVYFSPDSHEEQTTGAAAAAAAAAGGSGRLGPGHQNKGGEQQLPQQQQQHMAARGTGQSLCTMHHGVFGDRCRLGVRVGPIVTSRPHGAAPLKSGATWGHMGPHGAAPLKSGATWGHMGPHGVTWGCTLGVWGITEGTCCLCGGANSNIISWSQKLESFSLQAIEQLPPQKVTSAGPDLFTQPPVGSA